jgi:hypothetical protein
MKKLCIFILLLTALNQAGDPTSPKFLESWLLFSEKNASLALRNMRGDKDMQRFAKAMDLFHKSELADAAKTLEPLLEDPQNAMHLQSLYLMADIAMQQKNFPKALNSRVRGMDLLLTPEYAEQRAELFLQQALDSADLQWLQRCNSLEYLAELAGQEKSWKIPAQVYENSRRLQRMLTFLWQKWPETKAALKAAHYLVYISAESKGTHALGSLIERYPQHLQDDVEIRRMRLLASLEKNKTFLADSLWLAEWENAKQADVRKVLERVRVVQLMQLETPKNLEQAIPYLDSLWGKYPGDSLLVNLQQEIAPLVTAAWQCDLCPPADLPLTILKRWEQRALSREEAALWLLNQANLLEKRMEYGRAIELYQEFLQRFPQALTAPYARENLTKTILNQAKKINTFYKNEELESLSGGKRVAIAWMDSLEKYIDYFADQEPLLGVIIEWQENRMVKDGLSNSLNALKQDYLRKLPSGLAAETFRMDLCKEWIQNKQPEECLRRLDYWRNDSYWAREQLESMAKRSFELKEQVAPFQKDDNGEAHFVEVAARNIDSLRVRYYRIDAEEYFRSHQTLLYGLENLDIALAEPTADFKYGLNPSHRLLDDYKIPLKNIQTGLYMLQLSSDSLEAVRPLLISQAGLYLQNHRGQVYAWSYLRKDGAALRGTKVLFVQNGTWMECTTNSQGFCSVDLGDNLSEWQVLAMHDQGLAWSQINHSYAKNAANAENIMSEDSPPWQLLVYKNKIQAGDMLHYKIIPTQSVAQDSSLQDSAMTFSVVLDGQQNLAVTKRIAWRGEQDYLDSLRVPLVWKNKNQNGSAGTLFLSLKSGLHAVQKNIRIMQNRPQELPEVFIHLQNDVPYAGDTLQAHIVLTRTSKDSKSNTFWLWWHNHWEKHQTNSSGQLLVKKPLSLSLIRKTQSLRIARDSAGMVLAQKDFVVKDPEASIRAWWTEKSGARYAGVFVDPGRSSTNQWEVKTNIACKNPQSYKIWERDSTFVLTNKDTMNLELPASLHYAHCDLVVNAKAVDQNSSQQSNPQLNPQVLPKMYLSSGPTFPQPRRIKFSQEQQQSIQEATFQFVHSAYSPGEAPQVILQGSEQQKGWVVWMLGDSVMQVQQIELSKTLQKITGPKLPAMEGMVEARLLIPQQNETRVQQVLAKLSTKLDVRLEKRAMANKDSLELIFKAYNARGEQVPASLRLDVRSEFAMYFGLPQPGTYKLQDTKHIFNNAFFNEFSRLSASPLVFATIRQVRQDDGMSELREERKKMESKAKKKWAGNSKVRAQEVAFAEGGSGGIGDMLGGLLGGGSGAVSNLAAGRIAEPDLDWRDGVVLLFGQEFSKSKVHRIVVPASKADFDDIAIAYSMKDQAGSWSRVYKDTFELADRYSAPEIVARLAKEKTHAHSNRTKDTVKPAQYSPSGLKEMWYPSEMRLKYANTTPGFDEQLQITSWMIHRDNYCGSEVDQERCPDYYEWYADYLKIFEKKPVVEGEMQRFQQRMNRDQVRNDLNELAFIINNMSYVAQEQESIQMALLNLWRSKESLNLEGLTDVGKGFLQINRAEKAKEVAIEVRNKLMKKGNLPRWSAADAISFVQSMEPLPDDVLQYWKEQIQTMAAGVYEDHEACSYLKYVFYQLQKAETGKNSELLPKTEFLCLQRPQKSNFTQSNQTKAIIAYRAAQINGKGVIPGFQNSLDTGSIAGQNKLPLDEEFFLEIYPYEIFKRNQNNRDHSLSQEKSAISVKKTKNNKEWLMVLDLPQGLQALEVLQPGGQASPVAKAHQQRLLWRGEGTQDRSTRLKIRVRASQTGIMNITEPRIWQSGQSKSLGGQGILSIEMDSVGEPRAWSPMELEQLGLWHYASGRYEQAWQYLSDLLKKYKLPTPLYRNLAENLFDMAIKADNASEIVYWFEVAREHNPNLAIDVENLPKLVHAYQKEKIQESGSYLAASALKNMMEHEKEGIQNLYLFKGAPAAVQMAKHSAMEYPLSANTAQTYYAMAQILYSYVDSLAELQDDSWRKNHLQDVSGMLAFVQYQLAKSDTTDQNLNLLFSALYTLVNVYLEEKQPEQAVHWSQLGIQLLKNQEQLLNLGLLQIYALYQDGEYREALKTIRNLKAKASESNVTRLHYYTAQIFHAQNMADSALFYYRKVKDHYPDAAEYVYERERIELQAPSLVLLKKGDKAQIPVQMRNIKELDLRVFTLDVFKLLQSKGSLQALDQLQVSGIKPLKAKTIKGRWQSGAKIQESVDLGGLSSGAYLVMLRSPNGWEHSLVLQDYLTMDVDNNYPGRVRVSVWDEQGKPVVGAKVLLSTHKQGEFILGQTDRRGIFIAKQSSMVHSVTAFKEGRYGMFRSDTNHQQPVLTQVQSEWPAEENRMSDDSNSAGFLNYRPRAMRVGEAIPGNVQVK